jgi:hypothetical protein
VSADEDRDQRIAAILSDAEAGLSAWLLSKSIGEADETVMLLGNRVYERLGAYLDIDPCSDAAFAIVASLLSTGAPQDAATRQRVDLDGWLSTGAAS